MRVAQHTTVRAEPEGLPVDLGGRARRAGLVDVVHS